MDEMLAVARIDPFELHVFLDEENDQSKLDAILALDWVAEPSSVELFLDLLENTELPSGTHPYC